MKTNLTTFVSPPRPAGLGVPQASDTFKAHLVFMVDSEIYACPIEPIDRVLLRADATVEPKASGAPSWEVGRLAMKPGQASLPILSLRSLWGLPERAQSDREALLVVRLPDQSFVLLVEACLTVLSSLPPKTMTFRLPGQLRGTRGSAFESVISWQQSLLVTLQLNRLMSSEFENLVVPGPGESPRI